MAGWKKQSVSQGSPVLGERLRPGPVPRRPGQVLGRAAAGETASLCGLAPHLLSPQFTSRNVLSLLRPLCEACQVSPAGQDTLVYVGFLAPQCQPIPPQLLLPVRCLVLAGRMIWSLKPLVVRQLSLKICSHLGSPVHPHACLPSPGGRWEPEAGRSAVKEPRPQRFQPRVGVWEEKPCVPGEHQALDGEADAGGIQCACRVPGQTGRRAGGRNHI